MPDADDQNKPAAASDEGLRKILTELHEESKDVQVSMVVTRDGLTMSVVGGVSDTDKVGAMCSDLLHLCHSAAIELQRGEVEHVLMKASHGYMLLTPAGPQAMLAVMARPDTNLGMLLIDTRHAASLIPDAL